MPIRLGGTSQAGLNLAQGNRGLAGQYAGLGTGLVTQAGQLTAQENLRERYALPNAIQDFTQGLQTNRMLNLEEKKVDIADRTARQGNERGWANTGISAAKLGTSQFGKGGMFGQGGAFGKEGGSASLDGMIAATDSSPLQSIPMAVPKGINPADQVGLPGMDPNAAVVMPGGKPGQPTTSKALTQLRRERQGGGALGGSRFANIIQEMRANRGSKSVLPYSLA